MEPPNSTHPEDEIAEEQNVFDAFRATVNTHVGFDRGPFQTQNGDIRRERSEKPYGVEAKLSARDRQTRISETTGSL